MVKISKEWKEKIQLIPGYDPMRDSEGYYFDEKAAAKAIKFFRVMVTHAKGVLAGKPYMLEPWEVAIVANLWGWKHKETGYRRYRQAFVFVPRKNSKTTLAAGLILLALFTDNEPGAEVYSAAASRDQAALITDIVKQQIRNRPQLESRAKICQYSIVKLDKGKETLTQYKPLSSEAGTKHGLNPHVVVSDELHAQPNSELIDVLETGMGARTQPLMIHITTSDFDREGSICNEKHEYASNVRDGVIKDAQFLPVIYEAQPEDDWTSEEAWAAANPNLGKSVAIEYMRAQCEKAKQIPRYENTFKRLHLNIRTATDVRWLDVEKWQALSGVLPDLHKAECYGGLDIASKKDLTAFVLVFPLGEGRYATKQWFWVPSERMLERVRNDKVPYDVWVKQGYLRHAGEAAIDQQVLRRDIGEIAEDYDIQMIGVDPWNTGQLVQQLDEDGFEIAEMRQGFATLSEPSKTLEKLTLEGTITHDGNECMQWCVRNVATEEDAAGNIKPSKKKSTERIDGVVSLVMALALATANEGQEEFASMFDGDVNEDEWEWGDD